MDFSGEDSLLRKDFSGEDLRKEDSRRRSR